jgi:hypothetical protein
MYFLVAWTNRSQPPTEIDIPSYLSFSTFFQLPSEPPEYTNIEEENQEPTDDATSNPPTFPPSLP